MLLSRFGFALTYGLAALCCPTLAQSQNSNNTSQQPKAIQQLKAGATGAQPLSHIYEGAKAQPNPVQANPAAKPSPVGQPVHSTANSPGYKPAQPSMHSVNTATVPLPGSVAPKSVSSPQSTVARSTNTVSSSPTVARSTTTATVPAKKP
jgi:hypothetical protein